jgi:hypothetical protein
MIERNKEVRTRVVPERDVPISIFERFGKLSVFWPSLDLIFDVTADRELPVRNCNLEK